jgi:hypothetical protein
MQLVGQVLPDFSAKFSGSLRFVEGGAWSVVRGTWLASHSLQNEFAVAGRMRDNGKCYLMGLLHRCDRSAGRDVADDISPES